MNKYLKRILLYITSLIVIYLLTSFIAMDFNPVNWSFIGRLVITGIYLWSMFTIEMLLLE